MTVQVTRKDSAIWKRLRTVGTKHVRVGVPAGAGSYPDGGPSIAQVAAWNHEGTSRIPARPFLAVPLDGRTSEVKNMVTRVAQGVLTMPGQRDRILEALALWCRNRVVAAINAGFPPPNATSTERAKGSSLPLVDTGVLKGAIVGEVGDG